MQIVYLSPYDLVPYAQNAKQHPQKQIEHIANSIKQFGWQQPLVVDKDNVVIIGHGRLAAAKELKLDKVPVVYADNLTEEQVKALRLADNKTNESNWDLSKLEEELAELAIDGIDMEQFGFELTEGGESEEKQIPLKEQYQLIVDCDSETDMEEKYNMLQEVGIECRVSTL